MLEGHGATHRKIIFAHKFLGAKLAGPINRPALPDFFRHQGARRLPARPLAILRTRPCLKFIALLGGRPGGQEILDAAGGGTTQHRDERALNHDDLINVQRF